MTGILKVIFFGRIFFYVGIRNEALIVFPFSFLDYISVLSLVELSFLKSIASWFVKTGIIMVLSLFSFSLTNTGFLISCLTVNG
jgi:hypothetical protein